MKDAIKLLGAAMMCWIYFAAIYFFLLMVAP